MKIISGGQTGVDRAALDAAMDCSTKVGGWCPQGRRAEDGIIARKYPLRELASTSYRVRTRQNVIDSDATVIIYFAELSGGSKQTLFFCQDEHRPYKLIDAEQLSVHQAVSVLQEFIAQHAIGILNVAGPRASGEVRAYEYAYQVISLLMKAKQ